MVTNFARFPRRWESANGIEGESIDAKSAAEFRSHTGVGTVWLLNGETSLVLQLASRKLVSREAPPLIVADLVLRLPDRIADRMLLPAKRLALSRVDHFIHYFRDLRGMESAFGIGPDRSSFVPFKVNFLDRYSIEPSPEGDYVLCLGRSMRDFDTFFDAIETLPYPAAITTPDRDLFARHGTRFTRDFDKLPPNLQVLEDDGSDGAMIRIVRGAKLVVLPVLKSSIVASGISTALNAMILDRCVVGSEGPGMSDVFDEEIITARPEDPADLACAIRRVWEDPVLRRRTAAAGRRYALAAGGEPELYQRIVDRVALWLSARGEPGARD
jgi:glycosyltransferase involved in cell wall biosynthesis